VYALQTLALVLASMLSGIAVEKKGFVFVYLLVLAIEFLNILYTTIRIRDLRAEDRAASSGGEDATGNNIKESVQTDMATKDREMQVDDNETNSSQGNVTRTNDPNTQVPFSQLTWNRKLRELFSFRHFKDSFLVAFKRRPGDIRKCIIVITLILFTILVTSSKEMCVKMCLKIAVVILFSALVVRCIFSACLWSVVAL